MANPRVVACPNCNAKPGEPCSQPTDTGRRDVNWYHSAREGAALTSKMREVRNDTTDYAALIQFLFDRLAEEQATIEKIGDTSAGFDLEKIDAQRRILNRVLGWLGEGPDGTITDFIVRDILGTVVRQMAEPYSSWADYDRAWAIERG